MLYLLFLQPLPLVLRSGRHCNTWDKRRDVVYAASHTQCLTWSIVQKYYSNRPYVGLKKSHMQRNILVHTMYYVLRSTRTGLVTMCFPCRFACAMDEWYARLGLAWLDARWRLHFVHGKWGIRSSLSGRIAPVLSFMQFNAYILPLLEPGVSPVCSGNVGCRF